MCSTLGYNHIVGLLVPWVSPRLATAASETDAHDVFVYLWHLLVQYGRFSLMFACSYETIFLRGFVLRRVALDCVHWECVD